MSKNLGYKGYRRHRNREEDKKVCENFSKEFPDFKSGSYECYEDRYEFVTDIDLKDETKAKMVSLFGVRFVKQDDKTHIIIDARKEWINPLLVNDVLWTLGVIGVWLPLGIVTCYDVYFFFFH